MIILQRKIEIKKFRRLLSSRGREEFFNGFPYLIDEYAAEDGIVQGEDVLQLGLRHAELREHVEK